MSDKWVECRANETGVQKFLSLKNFLCDLAHCCVTVNVCRQERGWGKRVQTMALACWVEKVTFDQNISRLTSLTHSLVHDQAIPVSNCCLFHHLGLCGWDAHPQGCSRGQPGMYQSSLDLGSQSWVSHVIRSVLSLFLYYPAFQFHLCKESSPNSHSFSSAWRTCKFTWDVNVMFFYNNFLLIFI